VPAPTERGSLLARAWASRWPEAAWAVFAAGNLTWMVLMPSWSSLPFHFTWMSLLLLYGFGFRRWTHNLFWSLLIPVMAATGLLFVDARIRGLQPYDEVIELPLMVALFSAMVMHSNRRETAMTALDQVSRHNRELLERHQVFVQNASHELRTPITVALAHAELLPGPGGDPTAADDAAIVVDELARLRRLVDQLLLLATAEQQDLLRQAPVSLTSLAADALHRWEPTPRQWLAGTGDDTTVLADPERLMLAIDALLDNAVRFTSDGDRIELSVRRADGAAAIVVEDSGPGIPGIQDNRADRSGPADSVHHFGLGLSIVRAVAEAHGGRVTTGRSRLGGAAVALWLPLHDVTTGPRLAEPADPLPAVPGPALQ